MKKEMHLSFFDLAISDKSLISLVSISFNDSIKIIIPSLVVRGLYEANKLVR